MDLSPISQYVSAWHVATDLSDDFAIVTIEINNERDHEIFIFSNGGPLRIAYCEDYPCKWPHGGESHEPSDAVVSIPMEGNRLLPHLIQLRVMKPSERTRYLEFPIPYSSSPADLRAGRYEGKIPVRVDCKNYVGIESAIEQCGISDENFRSRLLE